MTFLSRLGMIVARVAGVVSGLGPIVGGLGGSKVAAIEKEVENDLALIAAIIAQAEAMGQVLKVPGADKLRMAAPLVAQIIMNSSIVAHKKIANEALFKKGCEEIAGGMADVLNSLHESAVSAQDLRVS